MKWQCQGCGDVVDANCAEPWDCVRCDDEMAPKDESKVVPKEDLEALEEKWRDAAALWDTSRTDTFNARCETWEYAAEELAELIEE